MSKIIECLKLMPEICSNTELANKMGLNWLGMLELLGKINQIEPDLVNITSSRLALIRELDWFDQTLISKYLSTFDQSKYIIKIIPEINSTSTFILNNLNVLSDKTIVTTELQLQGRGRGDNLWTSRLATDVAASILYFFPNDFEFELLPLITAVGLCRLLKQFGIRSYIKWPNDIYLQDKGKIAGILLESGIRDGRRFVVLGIGLNNIFEIKRNLLLSSLVNHMDHVIQEYKAFGFAMFRQEWLDNCIHLHKKVNIYQNDKLINSGLNIDLTYDGQLVIKNQEKISKYINGNVSLRLVDNESK